MRRDPREELILVLSIVVVMVVSGFVTYVYAISLNGP
jgi:hypothetical protein